MILATRLQAVCHVAGIAVAALGLYLMTGWVAAERKNVARLDQEIVRTKLEIAKLSIELDSRGRMGQLERWNNEVLALSAPKPDQFVADGVQLASLEGRVRRPALPLNPDVTAQIAPQKVAYTPAPELAPPPPRAMIQPAVATVTHSQPLLQRVAFVQDAPAEPVAPAPKPARAASARPAGLLPADIGRLAAAEAKASKDGERGR
jgi:hypothetical protein